MRGEEGRIYVKILLDHVFGSIGPKRKFIRLLLRRAARLGGQVFAAIWEWFVVAANFPGRLALVNRFDYEITRRRLQPPPQDCEIRQFITQTRILITSDCGGSLHSGCRFWKRKEQTRTISPLFAATKYGSLNLAEWLLWVGADPGHLKDEIPLLDLAPNASVRKEMVTMLISWGWDLDKLEVDLNNLEQLWLHGYCPWYRKKIKDGS